MIDKEMAEETGIVSFVGSTEKISDVAVSFPIYAINLNRQIWQHRVFCQNLSRNLPRERVFVEFIGIYLGFRSRGSQSCQIAYQPQPNTYLEGARFCRGVDISGLPAELDFHSADNAISKFRIDENLEGNICLENTSVFSC